MTAQLCVFQLKTFSTRDGMMQQTLRDPEGSLLYVTTTGNLFLKVSQGWKEIQVQYWGGHMCMIINPTLMCTSKHKTY